MSNRLNYFRDSTALSPNLIMPSDPRIQGDEIVFDNGQRLNWKKGFTKDAFTYDQFTVDSTGAFLVGELERLDQNLHDPLVAVTWGRDIDLREDVTIADEVSSFTNSTFASAGGINPAGKAWISKDATAISGIALDIGKTTNPLYLWGMEIKYTIPELESAQKIGRPIDIQKYDGMKLKYQMDIDEQVYIGDSAFGVLGLTNKTLANGAAANQAVSVTNAVTAGASSPTSQSSSTKWIDKTPQEILADVNTLLTNTWINTGWSIMPDELRVPPVEFGLLVSTIVSSAGNQSLLRFLQDNSLCNASNGRPLNIQPVKWLTGRGVSGVDRMFCYTKDRNRVRFPLVPLQRTPMETRGMYQIVTYFGRIGVVEFVYPECVGYMDGIG